MAANDKITELTELSATPDNSDILVIVDDPAGTPVTKKITVANLVAAVTSVPRTIQMTVNGSMYVADGVVWVRVPYAMTVAKVRAGVQTDSTSGSVDIDIRYKASDPDDGAAPTTILNSDLQISAASNTAETTSFAQSSLAAGGWIVLDINAAGTGASNLVVEILE